MHEILANPKKKNHDLQSLEYSFGYKIKPKDELEPAKKAASTKYMNSDLLNKGYKRPKTNVEIGLQMIKQNK